MDIFMKVLGIIIALAFLFVGFKFLFQSSKMIQGIQKIKYKQSQKPRKQELIFTRIIGVILILIGLYYSGVIILSFLA